MPEMSWLSPKRRRTTGNLKTIPNGQMKAVAEGDETETPTTPTKTGAERPAPSPRPLSQPNVQGSQSEDGNLFYAYARKGDDVRSRYLLTFASASIANEWWLLVQAHFPDCTRPGAQLFSFQTPDLMSKAWKYPGFEHLRSKWMYIAFSDTSQHGLGGAAQGIIPVQDVQGNMLGGSAPASPEFGQQIKKEAKEMRNDIGRLEEYFEKMMEAVERNTESVRKLAEERKAKKKEKSDAGFFDIGELSGHFGRITDLLTRNMEHMESISKTQFDNEKKLRAVLADVSARQRGDYLDMSQLSSHLDRIQHMMEHSVVDRRDSAMPSQEHVPLIDLAPLKSRMESLQKSVEQNSSLMQSSLEERSSPPQLDFTPLKDQLQSIHAAIEQHTSHTKHLTRSNNRDDSNIFEDILDAQHATREAIEQNGGEIDFAPMAEYLEAVQDATTENTEQLRSLVQLQQEERDRQPPSIDFTPMTDRLNQIHASLQKSGDYFGAQSPGTGDSKFLISALTSHLSKIQGLTEQNASAIKSIRDRPTTSTDKAISETNEQLRALTQTLSKRQSKSEDGVLERRLDATTSQVRELMTGQKEMVDVMRELALSITAQNKEICDHVVVPPPRTMGRKIVGFVYDAKEGGL